MNPAFIKVVRELVEQRPETLDFFCIWGWRKLGTHKKGRKTLASTSSFFYKRFLPFGEEKMPQIASVVVEHAEVPDEVYAAWLTMLDAQAVVDESCICRRIL